MKNLKNKIKNIVAGWPNRQIKAGYLVDRIGNKYVYVISQWQDVKSFKMTLKDFYCVYVACNMEANEEMYK